MNSSSQIVNSTLAESYWFIKVSITVTEKAKFTHMAVTVLISKLLAASELMQNQHAPVEEHTTSSTHPYVARGVMS